MGYAAIEHITSEEYNCLSPESTRNIQHPIGAIYKASWDISALQRYW
jgi:hypothetical protein